MNPKNQIFRSSPSPHETPHPPSKPKHQKMNFKTFKNNTISSLKDVEFFLNNFNKLARCIKLYKILK